mgnify:CR=1 FL=1
MRIGQGFDVHQFCDDRPLIIGGIEVPSDRGLLGHSDADVLIHAICDALLGALALGDIGNWFPDNDPQFKGADSKVLLKTIIDSDEFADWNIGNIDSQIIAQAPKMAPHIPAMRAKLAEVCGIELNQVSVKATTTEKLGFTGRKEGIAAQAVVLLTKKN